MLEPPDVPDEQIVACLDAAYGLSIAGIEFLPLGFDVDTAVYRVATEDAAAYFLKLRRGPFPEATVTIPHWLAQAGMPQLISPVATRTGASWARLNSYTAILYPFVTGLSGWEAALSREQWIELGAGLRALHTADVPSQLSRTLPRETYEPVWRGRVSAFLRRAADHVTGDPIAAALVDLLQARQDIIHHIVERAERLAGLLVHQPPEPCLCHGDIHAGNVLIEPTGRLYLVDWDTLILAPKERDLMFIGGGIGGVWNGGREVEWFYEGYGRAAIDWTALTYYRYERIARDIAEICEQLLETSGAGEDRCALLGQLSAQFEPGNVVEIALATDRRGQAES